MQQVQTNKGSRALRILGVIALYLALLPAGIWLVFVTTDDFLIRELFLMTWWIAAGVVAWVLHGFLARLWHRKHTP